MSVLTPKTSSRAWRRSANPNRRLMASTTGRAGVYRSVRRLSTTRTTRDSAARKSSCSQTRTTVQPASTSTTSVSRSRVLFRSILLAQKSRFRRGTDQCSGQPCQKQPSTNTATRSTVKTTSGVNRTPGSTFACFRNRRPRRCRADRSATSGAVSRLLLACIDARVAGEDAGGAGVMRLPRAGVRAGRGSWRPSARRNAGETLGGCSLPSPRGRRIDGRRSASRQGS
jgi:hypothetical protein